MDDRLQRRLRDADPLTAADGQQPDEARLDAIKEHIMQTDGQGVRQAPAHDPAPRRHSLRPRAIGFTALAATGLAVVLVGVNLAQPGSAALAWDPSPTAVTAAQKAAATEACTPKVMDGGLAGAPVAAPEGGAVEGGQVTVTAQGGAVGVVGGTGSAGGVPEQGSVSTSGEGTITTTTGPGGALPEIEIPPFPTELPPLVYMEQHGTGAVAVFADETTTAYCLLVKKGDGYDLAALQMPVAGGGSMGVAVGLATVAGGPDTGHAPTTSAMAMAGDGDFQVSAMTASYGDAQVGIIAGSAPDGAVTIKVEGGPADGATANVSDGTFALWAPKALDGGATLVALDAAGTELGSVTIGGVPPAGAPVVVDGQLPAGATAAP
jgi:hypothetical protein